MDSAAFVRVSKWQVRAYHWTELMWKLHVSRILKVCEFTDEEPELEGEVK